MSIDVNVTNDLVIVTETTEDIVVNVSNAAGPQGPAGQGVPVGGTAGQVLKKLSNTNYDTFWTLDGVGVPYTGATGDVNLGAFNLTATSIIKSGGTSSQFLKADGSVDSSTYQPLLTNPVTGTGATGQVAYWNGTNSQTGSNNLFWDAANARLGIGTNTPSRKLHVIGTSALFQNAGAFELDLLNTTSGNYLRATAGATDANIGTIQNIPFSFIMNGARVGQFTSTNGNLILQNGGTFTDGGQRLQVQGTSYFSDRIGFNSTATTNVTLRNELPISGSTSSFGYYTSSIIQSGVTSSASYFSIAPQTQAASFTLSRLSGFEVNALSIGAGSTVTEASAFYGNIASGTGRWNLYMAGTANNYLAGSLGIGTTSPSASAILQADSTTKGFLPPRMTNAQRTAISSPAVGLLVYQTDAAEGTYEYISSGWRIINGGGGGGVDELQVSLICQVFG